MEPKKSALLWRFSTHRPHTVQKFDLIPSRLAKFIQFEQSIFNLFRRRNLNLTKMRRNFHNFCCLSARAMANTETILAAILHSNHYSSSNFRTHTHTRPAFTHPPI